ncbi:MAG TPA: calcium-binding protein, partial [Polymorphobacter sp.]|nr:calcium-binding protein [Polymorphobacter sp.]
NRNPKGITITGGHDFLIDNNDIYNLRTTPISGSVTSNLTISNNHTWDSRPWQFGGNGDHGDRIHIWTSGTPITGLVIANNYLDQGAGDPMLGIYLDDNGTGMGFTNAIITGNTLIDGTGQGVLLENVSGTVSNNALIWSGTGTASNNSPRFDINAGSDHINFTDNTGNVSIQTGSTYLDFVRQNGMIAEDATMTSAQRDTITIDYMVITARNSYTLNATTSDLYFEGGTGNFVGTGNALANHIVGGTGADTLTGNGGADYLEGKTGNDTYVVDNLGQVIYDSGGTELIKSKISWTLQTGIENLTYIGTGGATLAGNSAPNTIIGGAGNDTLIGNGGADKLQGGLGDDTYILDNSNQLVNDSGGVDTIVSNLNKVLQSGIENLTLTGAAVFATGNAVANTLIGNDLNNTLDGKAGADLMYGNAGDDTYIVDNVGALNIDATPKRF